MKKFLLACCLFFITVNVFGQQFSQYNTGSLYESFENPSQRAFIPDTSREYAFNFFLPNISSNLFITGHGQEALRTRAFNSYYNTADLQTQQGGFNRANVNANVYILMFKLYASMNGDQEIGFSLSTKGELRGTVTDESIALFNGFTNFPNTTYVDIFNDNYHHQIYHQLSFTYREQVNKRLAVGVKLSALSGLSYRKVTVDGSSVVFDREADQATISAHGTTYNNGVTGISNWQKIMPSFLNPGASVSLSASYVDESGYKWQGNIKDLGFIRWNSGSAISAFNATKTIPGFSSADRENTIFNRIDSITTSHRVKQAFVTNTNGLAELSVNRTFWINDNYDLKFSPTLIASKEIFYNGFTGALVAPVQYRSLIGTITTSYNELRLFSWGAQFMVKGPNSEFFIGSERVYQTASLAKAAINSKADPNQTQLARSRPGYTGMDFFIGASFKFGNVIEHPMNASYIPNGEKGFIGRLWDKLFNKDRNY